MVISPFQACVLFNTPDVSNGRGREADCMRSIMGKGRLGSERALFLKGCVVTLTHLG